MAPCDWQWVPVAFHLEYFCVYLFMFSFLSYCTSILNPCTAMSSNLVTAALLLIFFGLFETTVGDPFSHRSSVYSCEQLLVLRRPGLPFTNKPKIPEELRRRRRGCWAGIKRRERARQYKPCLLAIFIGNVHSLSNKMDELTAMTQLHRHWEYQECNIMLFTESWLYADIPDTL